MTDDEELLWEHLMLEFRVPTNHFGWNLVGIGALLFAYGEASSPFLRAFVALVGMAASVLQWEHSWGARVEADWFESEIRSTRPELMARFDNARSWRKSAPLGGGWVSIRTLIIYFHGLLALGWSILLVRAVTRAPDWSLWAVLSLGLIASLLWGLLHPHRGGTVGWSPIAGREN